MPDEERLERSVTLLAQYVIDGDLDGDLAEAINEVLDELDTLDKDLTNEFGSGADDATAVQKGLAEWKRWRQEDREDGSG